MANSDLMAKLKRIIQLKRKGRVAQALQRAEALAVEHPGAAVAHSLLGDVHFVAAVRAREAATGSEEEQGDAASRSETHLRKGRDALSQAQVLAPDSVDVAIALAGFLIESGMFCEAETEYCRALAMEMDTATAASPAVNSPYPSTPNQRREACQRLANRLVSCEVKRIMEIGKTGAVVKTDSGAGMKTNTDGDAEMTNDNGVAVKTDGEAQKPEVPEARMSKEARSLAKRFPKSARAKLCNLITQLQLLCSLPRHLDMRKGVEHLVHSAGIAAHVFPNSVVIALFHAKLLLLSGRIHAAEAECHRALGLENVCDPEDECVPPGSVAGDDYEARLTSVAQDFHRLLEEIIHTCQKFWENSLSTESKQRLLLVKIDVVQSEHENVDRSPLFSIQSALRFFEKNNSWKFWMCPICDSDQRHTLFASLMEHMSNKHSRMFLPRLQSAVSSTLEPESGGLFDGVSFTQDEDKHDIIRFQERSGIFRSLFSEIIYGLKARRFAEFRRENCSEGKKLLLSMKNKMASLPTDKCATNESPMLHEIRELWLQFLKCTVFDYSELLLTSARISLWSEFKKHMAGVRETECQIITVDDINAVFCTWSDGDKQTVNEEISYSTVDQETGDILNIKSKDIDLMDIILRTLWTLSHFTDQVLRTEALCSKHNHHGPCVGDIVHKIFCSWEKNEYHRQDLSSLANAVHRSLDVDDFFEKDQINVISDLTFAILNGLHFPDVSLHLGFVGDMSGEETSIFKCKYHDSIGLKFLMHMSCGCQTCSSDKPDADPSMIEQLCNQSVHWSCVRDDQKSFAEILNGWVEPVMTYHYARGTAYYKLVSMICYLDGFSIGIAGKDNFWIIYTETEEVCRFEATWQGLLDKCRNCRPAVLFYEVIKYVYRYSRFPFKIGNACAEGMDVQCSLNQLPVF